MTHRFFLCLALVFGLAPPALADSNALKSKAGLSPAPIMMHGVMMPVLYFEHFDEQISRLKNTDLVVVSTRVAVRFFNPAHVDSRWVQLSVGDKRQLYAQQGASPWVPSLKPGQWSAPIVVTLAPNYQHVAGWSPVQYQQQWLRQRDVGCGIDLFARVAPFGGASTDFSLYYGIGSSQAWQDHRDVRDTVICDDRYCTSLDAVRRNVFDQLGCKTVGYALFVGSDARIAAHYDARGMARTALDGVAPAPFTPATRMELASVTKALVGLTAMRELGNTIDQPAYSYFPAGWAVPAASIVRGITIRELLTQTSGVKDRDVGDMGAAALQGFFTQAIARPDGPRLCDVDPSNAPFSPIVRDKSPCYSNINFAVMRYVLPRATGAPPSQAADAVALANRFEATVAKDVFEPVGVFGLGCHPTGDVAYAHKFPQTVPGGPFKNASAQFCGAAGWYASVTDLAAVLGSLNMGDHKILGDCALRELEFNIGGHPGSPPVGFDSNTLPFQQETYRHLGKNGGDNIGAAGEITSAFVIFGGHVGCGRPFGPAAPMPGVAAALLINSNISQRQGFGAMQALDNALEFATVKKN